MAEPPTSKTVSDSLAEIELLKQEYFFLQATIEDYNKQIWVIKALGITATGATIVLSLQQKQNLIALFGCAIPFFFWILESQWKHFQHGFYPRVAEIESMFSQAYNLCSPRIYSQWCTTLKRHSMPKHRSYVLDGLLNPSVFISYLLEILFLLLLSLIEVP